MIKKRSTDNRKCRYVQGGNTDIYKNRLGWWEKRTFTRSPTDIVYVINEIDEGRADIISFNLYGTEEYDWLVLQYNNIIDPVEELKKGTKIYMPRQDRLILDIITKTEGGNLKG